MGQPPHTACIQEQKPAPLHRPPLPPPQAPSLYPQDDPPDPSPRALTPPSPAGGRFRRSQAGGGSGHSGTAGGRCPSPPTEKPSQSKGALRVGVEPSRLAPRVGGGGGGPGALRGPAPQRFPGGPGRCRRAWGWDAAPSSGPQGAARCRVLRRPAFPPRGQEAAPVDAGRRAVPAVDGGAVGLRAPLRRLASRTRECGGRARDGARSLVARQGPVGRVSALGSTAFLQWRRPIRIDQQSVAGIARPSVGALLAEAHVSVVGRGPTPAGLPSLQV